MQVKLAKHSGFCFGVKKAVEEASNVKGKANTFGPLIHNPQVVQELAKKGITKIDRLEDADASSIIIRTHGASDKLIHEISSKGYNIIDLTCPFVKKVQEYAKDLEKVGYRVVVIGEKDHPEVLAIADNLKNPFVVEKPEDVDGLVEDKIGVVVQTTQSVQNFAEIIKKLGKWSDVKVHNTICNATKERQESAAELAEKVDLMIVVGGKSSGNTKRLVELCSGIKETKHIETDDDLQREWFDGKNVVGVTAGASTPDWVIRRVVKRIENEF